jgi:6-phosphogluconate dehydrogenase
MIGCGSMGGGMALLFAEIGVHVSLSDPSEEAMDAVIAKAEKSGYNGKVNKFTGKLCENAVFLRMC